MQDRANTIPTRVPWNKGKVTGAKPTATAQTCLRYPGRADMLCPTSNRRFVPMVLQNSQNAVRAIFRK